MSPEDKRLIEVAFPLKQVSLDSVHEKNVRHGHISTLHIWPARRPLAACRAALIATLLPDPGNPEERKAILERMAGRIIGRPERKRGERPCGRAGQGRDGGRYPALGPGERAGSGMVPCRDPQGLRRQGAQGARPLRGRRRDSPRSDAPRVRGDGHGHQPGGLVHPQVHSRIPAEAGRPDPAAARVRAAGPGVHGSLPEGQGLQGRPAAEFS